MKRVFTVGIVLLFLLFPAKIKADTLSEVLNLYGSYIEIMEVEAYKKDLFEAKQNYSSLKNNLYRDQFFKSIAEIIETRNEDLQNPMLEADTNRKYLISLVKVKADLKLIFEAENAYRNSLKNCNYYLQNNKKFSLDTYKISGVTIEELNKSEKYISEINKVLSNAIILPDIGELSNLKSSLHENWKIISSYGYRENKNFEQQFHNGIDLISNEGVDVTSLFNGKVIKAGYFGDDYGNCVLISHSNEFQTFYAHMSSISVKTGDYVTQYQKIGSMEKAKGDIQPYLHLGVFINGQKMDPSRLFEGGG